ncbi:kinesin-like protein KIN-14K isoform X2 [Phragmites australis]|uniref:kinesin-like protein KIN-14K isoform X2 n=1 Tax=Phragmites australis TaxID=29695 RepID=UPI002D78A62C|nr:kinesin-like protein KIN-14K isoform X2 [Phragmites australis]
MGSVDGEVEGIHAANRRAEVVEWLNALLPEFSLPSDSSDEELRELLSDGTVLCHIVSTLIPGVLEGSWGSYASSDQRSGSVKKFLSVLADMGLPGFSVKDLDEGSMSSVVECLLVLRDSVDPRLGDGTPLDVDKTPVRKQWGVPEMDRPQVPGAAQGKRSPGEGRRHGQKFREVFQLKRGSYSDLPAGKISEMMHSNSLDAPTQSLVSVVNGILDESIERKKGEIPHRVVYLLRKVVQEIECRLCMQAEHIRSQNIIIKTREEKYRSKIKALEILVNGTNEENQMAINRLRIIKDDNSKIEERRKLGEQDVVRLMKEKEHSENIITSLKNQMEDMSRMHEQQLEKIERKAKQMEEQLTNKVKEVEYLLLQSNKKIEEVESVSELKSQLWNKKENIFQSYMDNQQLHVKDIRITSRSVKNDIYTLQMKWRDEMSNLGSGLKCLFDAAENYHKVLAENQKLFNEVQELKGNIRVYCRVRPFLPGQDKKSTTVDYIGENGELLISNPFKQGKDGHRMFKFNKVFSPMSSQAEVFSDIQPLIRSVLDGFNVCIFAYGQTGSGKTYTMSGPSTSKQDWGVNYRALNDLFDISLSRRNAFSYEVGVQMVEIYNEQVRDLLSNNIAQKRLGIWNTSQPNGLVVPDASLHQVKSTSDVLDLMEIGQANRAVGSTALNERSSRSHSILTVHVRGVDLKNGSTSRGCLHLIDLAGSERVERSEATGDRLKEAQHINRSLSALGDVIFALAQKNAHVPYRNSKLTQVLQSSLGGQAKTLMFVQINPDVESYSETISTLKFAERVSGVELGAARSNKEGKDIKELLEQVASLKDTISRKDTEIEQLQLIKDKVKSTNLSFDRNGAGFLMNTINQPSQLLLGERILKSTDRVLSDPQSYAEVNGDHDHNSPTDTTHVGLDEAEYEDNASDDGLSAGEAEYSNSDRTAEMTTERMHRVPSRITRFSLTKNGQPSRSKPRDAVLQTPSHTKAPTNQFTGGSSARGSKRWQ